MLRTSLRVLGGVQYTRNRQDTKDTQLIRALSIQPQNILNYAPLSHLANQTLTVSIGHHDTAVMEHIILFYSSSQLLGEHPGKEHNP